MQEIFKSIYENSYSKLCIYARQFVLSDEEAEEIVQNSIFKLWEKRSVIHEISNIESYLYKSVYNGCLNFLNHLKYINKHKSEAWLELKRLELAATDEIIIKELKTTINDAINTLPNRCKEVFLLSRNSGLKNKEIAQKLSISVKAVEANISRALKILREKLECYMPLVTIYFLTAYFPTHSHYNVELLLSYLSK